VARRTTFRFGGTHVRRTRDGNGDTVVDRPALTAVAGGLPDRAADLVGRLDTCLRELHAVQRDLDGQLAHCRRVGLPVEESVLGRLVDTTRQAKRQLSGQQQALLGEAEPASADLLGQIEPVLRYGITTLAYVRGTLASCSPALRRTPGPVDGGPAAARVEEQLLDVFGLSPDEYAVTATTSGAAAFSLVEAFLARERLRPGDTVLLAPTVGAEVAEQVASLSFVKVRTAHGHHPDDLVAAALRHRPRVVFADPLDTTVAQRMIDLPGLCDGLRSAVPTPTTVVVDGTSVSGVLPAALHSDGAVEVLYYERGSALQLGLDAGVAGIVVHPAALRSAMHQRRHDAGLVPSATAAELFPRYDDDTYRWRAARTGGNALRLATLLADDPRMPTGTVGHPGLVGHPDAELARRLHQPDTVTLAVADPARHARRIADRAGLAGVDVVVGGPIGAPPSITVVDDAEAPFLRLHVGDRVDQVDVLAEACAAAGSGQ
jgi:cystathionine gamma-synthase